MQQRAAFLFIPLLFSCAATMEVTVRKRAAEDLECQSDSIRIDQSRQDGGKRYLAQGCDKRTFYDTKCTLFFCKVTDGGQVIVDRGPTAPPQEPYTEAQLSEYTAAAEAKVKEGADRVETLRLAGTFPKSKPHELMVKGGHCYTISAAWQQSSYATSFGVMFGKDADGKSVNASVGGSFEKLGPTDVMNFCADIDGPVTLTASITTTEGSVMSDPKRKDPVEWAVAVAERSEGDATEARQAAEAKAMAEQQKTQRARTYSYEAKRYGRQAADVCEICREQLRDCLAEHKEKGPQEALNQCVKPWKVCTVGVGGECAMQ